MSHKKEEYMMTITLAMLTVIGGMAMTRLL